MNFDFSDDQKLLKQTVHDYLRSHCSLAVNRGVLEGDAPYSEKVWQGVAEMGLLGTAIPEAYGGAGLGHLELALIAEEMGRALAPIPFSSTAYLATEALCLYGTQAQKERYLPKIAAGEVIGTLAHVEEGGRPVASDLKTRFVGAKGGRGEGGKLCGEKAPVLDGDVAALAVVSALEGDAPCLALVDLSADGVARSALRSIDPSRSQARLTLTDAPAERLGEVGAGWAQLSHLLDRAAVLTAFEQLGGADRALAITLDYTRDRYTFGRPVASYQAIKHRLADLFVTLELARSNSYYGAWALHAGSPELATAACASRAAASQAFDLAGTEMVQLHGGVGFTWEADCHLFYRRARLLSLWLGSPGAWQDKLIRRLAAA